MGLYVKERNTFFIGNCGNGALEDIGYFFYCWGFLKVEHFYNFYALNIKSTVKANIQMHQMR
jgi:hypothetical protein